MDYIRGLLQRKRGTPAGKRVDARPFPGRCYGWIQPGGGKSRTTDRETRMQVSAHSAKKKNTYAITWSIAACLIIGFGISSYFLFLKKSMTDEVFIAEESVSTKLAEPAAPPTPAIPATPTVPATPQKEIALATTKVKTDSTPISEITARQADKKDMIAKIQRLRNHKVRLWQLCR